MWRNKILFKKLFLFFLLLPIIVSCGISKSLKDVPNVSAYNNVIPKRVKTSDSTFVVGNNTLNKNKQGLWELYVAGDPLERGLITGSLTQELFNKQENDFLSKEKELYALADSDDAKREKPLPKYLELNRRIRYKVRSGDYLGRIAKKFGVRVSQIKKWNRMRNNNLKIGQRLTIFPRRL